MPRIKSAMPHSYLELENVSVRYGGIHALCDVNLFVGAGEIVAIMGPNGAGKSTVLKACFGLAPIEKGHVRVNGIKAQILPHEIVRAGISFVPQGRRVFASLTVRENLEVGGYIIPDKKSLHERVERVMDFFPFLREKARMHAKTLSGGQQQMLAIARGLIVQPRLLLLDEPTLGLSPKMVKEVFAKFLEIKEHFATSLLVVEHNLKSFVDIVDRVYVLHKGSVALSGPRDHVLRSDILERVAFGTL